MCLISDSFAPTAVTLSGIGAALEVETACPKKVALGFPSTHLEKLIVTPCLLR